MEERCCREREPRRHRRRRSTSSDRANAAAPPPPPMKKVQVFYYLSRNGRLEQPHFLEIALFPNHPLRLKDFMDRLTVLRGKAMPSLYSWSCKRNYKNGYVWNDLSENDVVYPAEGAEYVLKGSELLDACSEKLQQIHMSNSNNRNPVQEPNHPNRTQKPQLGPSPLRELDNNPDPDPDPDSDYDEVEDYEFDDGDKPTYAATPHSSRCSRGVATEDSPTPPPTQTPTESTRFDSSRLSTSKRFASDEDEPGTESPPPSRNSVLMQLIACGGGGGGGGGSAGSKVGRRTERLGRGVVCKMAGKLIGEEEMIKCMSENPRFGKLQTEEKEYFSGSIVESIREDQDRHVVQPQLKKSNSCNEEKSKREKIEEDEDEEKRVEDNGYDGGIKGRCIPRMISAASSKQPKKL